MSQMNPTDARREHPSAYFVQDRSNEEELTRLHLQDQMVTTGMGGVFAEQAALTGLDRVLDVGCGTGGWLIEVAKAYPHTTTLIGVDISKKMVEYARRQAKEQQVDDRVEFHVMDAIRMLEFPDKFFDLVNQRFPVGYVRTWEWPKLLEEFQRVVRGEGIVRITDLDAVVENTSPTLTRLMQMFTQVFQRAGNFFPSDNHGICGQLASLLRHHGFQNVQTHIYTLEFRAGTPEGKRFAEDMRLVYRTAVPFFRKWTRLPEDYEELYQQALEEMQQPDFVATWHLLTAWGQRL